MCVAVRQQRKGGRVTRTPVQFFGTWGGIYVCAVRPRAVGGEFCRVLQDGLGRLSPWAPPHAGGWVAVC